MAFSNYLARLKSNVEHATGISFRGSSNYWDRRYARGGTSGTGSYGRLAEFKAEYLNAFVAKNGLKSVIEFGCGDGHQLSLANYPNYFGVDVSRQALDLCRKAFRNDPSKRFGHSAPSNETFDAALSLDVIYHLVEDEVFERYMKSLFAASAQWVIIYSSDIVHVDFEKNYPDYSAPHVKHRKFTDWVNKHSSDWQLIGCDRNPYPFRADDPGRTSFADFFLYKRE